MLKYNMDPRTATGWKICHFSLISMVLFSASASLFYTSLAFVFVEFRISTSSTSSKRFVFEVVSFYSKVLSSSYRDFLLAVTSLNNWLRLSSSIHYFFVNTTDNSYCSNPCCVTVKSMTCVLAESSGENLGFPSFVVKNILKFGL